MSLLIENTQLSGVIGVGAAVIAAFSRWADIRRLRRRDPDAVGFMPWTAIYFCTLFIACIMLGVAARTWGQN